jgi:hypothetical protein
MRRSCCFYFFFFLKLFVTSLLLLHNGVVCWCPRCCRTYREAVKRRDKKNTHANAGVCGGHHNAAEDAGAEGQRVRERQREGNSRYPATATLRALRIISSANSVNMSLEK